MRLVAVALSVTLLACLGSVKPSTPPASHGIEVLVAALRSDEPRPAYRLLSDGVRRSLTFEEFAVLWKQSALERKHQADTLEEGLKGNPNLGERAQVTYPDGKSVHLLREEGGWKLESALVSRFHAGRPHDAIKIFAEALASRNYEGMLRILSNRRRSEIGGQVDEFSTSLVAHQDDQISFISKTTAELRWDEGDKRYRVVLKREGDEWRVDAIHIRVVPPTDKDGKDKDKKKDRKAGKRATTKK